MPKFLDYNPEQVYLLPPSVRDVLGENHVCFFLHQAVEALELSAFEQGYADDGRPACGNGGGKTAPGAAGGGRLRRGFRAGGGKATGTARPERPARRWRPRPAWASRRGGRRPPAGWSSCAKPDAHAPR